MSPPVVTFSHLKRTVSIETVLNAEGLVTSLKRRGQRLVGLVPCMAGTILMPFTDRPDARWR
jgi:hypothetical protein